MMNGDVQMMPGTARQFGGFKYPFQQQNPLLNASPAQRLGFFHSSDGKSIGVVQRTGDAHQSMTITIGLNCGRHPLAGGRRPYPLQIVNQRPQIEAHCGCSTHNRNL